MLAKQQKHKQWGKMLATIDGKQIYGVRLMTNREPESDNIPRPPSGYSCWLEYALDCMDMRSLELDSLFNDDSTFDRDAVRLAARRELDSLRSKAATLDKLLAVSSNKSTPV